MHSDGNELKYFFIGIERLEKSTRILIGWHEHFCVQYCSEWWYNFNL